MAMNRSSMIIPEMYPVESFWWGDTKESEAENGIAEIYENIVFW